MQIDIMQFMQRRMDFLILYKKQVILLIIMILSVITAQILNSLNKSQVDEIVNTSNVSSIFYYDLGGTNCVCSKSWSIIENLEKLFTGFAFNFPHAFDAFHFQIFLNKPLYIVLVIFTNEFIEEFLLLITGKWGFSLDPYSDLEPRYDSLIRDIITCILGLILGIKFVKIFHVESLLKNEIKCRRDWRRNIVVIIEGVIVWQLVLSYNADKGINKFNSSNMVLIICYNITLIAMYYFNKTFYSQSTEKHIKFCYLLWILFSTYFLIWTVYPFLDSMYLLIFVVASIYLILIIFENIIIPLNIYDIATIINSQNYHHPNAIDIMQNVRIKSMNLDSFKSILNEYIENNNYIDIDDIDAFFKFLVEKQNNIQIHQSKTSYFVIFEMIICVGSIIFAFLSPFHYDKDNIIYRRHWCGNPDVHNQNGCIAF